MRGRHEDDKGTTWKDRGDEMTHILRAEGEEI